MRVIRNLTMLTQHAVGAITVFGSLASAAAPPADVAAFMAIQRPKPSAEIRYGTAAAQGVDVFVPDGAGPHPVAILVHGGCWSVHTAGREQLRHLGADLSRRGIAVWSIGYRRANEASGGYPGTYEDVATAIDLLPSLGPAHRVDPSRSVLIGHSAGGHLALWAAARAGLPTNSPLKTRHPFLPPSVISLAGIGDVRRSAAAICGADIAQRLAAPAVTGAQVDSYADVSPATLPPPDSRIVMVSALLDRLVAPALADDHVHAMHAKGKWSIDHIRVAEAGHFDLVTPGTAAWREVLRQIEAALAPGQKSKTTSRLASWTPQPHEVNTP
jgi:acetyl esterase/lipase